MTDLSNTTRGRRYHFFKDADSDQLLSMLLATLSELSVTRERLFAIERLAEEKGLFTSAELEAYKFSPEEEDVLGQNQSDLLKEVFYPLEFDYRPAVKRSADGESSVDAANGNDQSDENGPIPFSWAM